MDEKMTPETKAIGVLEEMKEDYTPYHEDYSEIVSAIELAQKALFVYKADTPKAEDKAWKEECLTSFHLEEAEIRFAIDCLEAKTIRECDKDVLIAIIQSQSGQQR